MFVRVAEVDRLDVRTHAPATRVAREPNHVRINDEEFDEVIFTNDLPDAVRMLQAPSELERAVSESLTASTFITTLFEADRWPVRARMGYVMNPLLPNPSFSLSGVRDIRYRFPEASGEGCAAVAYQYADRLLTPTEVDGFAARFLPEMGVLGFQGVRVIRTAVWPYFFRFTKPAVAAGLPWRLFAEQGTQRTWFAGSSACFESLNDVMRYNLLLVERYAET